MIRLDAFPDPGLGLGFLAAVQMNPETACVYCRRRPVDLAWRPFCSERCKLLDLGEWVDERYRIPAAPDRAETEDDEEPRSQVRSKS